MSLSKSSKSRFSILNLVLVNQKYPLDFFLRITAPSTNSVQETPIIKANENQCEEPFPWQFSVDTNAFKLQFIQLSSAKIQVRKSFIQINGYTDQDGEAVAMKATRTGKKLCIVTYKMQKFPEQKGFNKDNFEFSSGQRGELSTRTKNFSKQQHEQLSKQIADINKSIDKILNHEKTEHAVFSRYLDQSTSFIRQIMNNSMRYNKKREQINEESLEEDLEQQNQMTVNNILKDVSQINYKSSPIKSKSKQKQEKGGEVTKQDEKNSNNPPRLPQQQSDKKQNLPNSSRWYQQKYKKERPLIQKNKNYKDLQTPSKKKLQVIIECENNVQSPKKDKGQSLVLSDLSFNSEIKPCQILFFENQREKPIICLKSSVQTYDWKKTIEMPGKELIVLTAFNKQGNQVHGCIGQKQLQKGRVSLYDENGVLKGILTFKFKVLGVYFVQTIDVLALNEAEEEEKPKNEKSNDKMDDKMDEKNKEEQKKQPNKAERNQNNEEKPKRQDEKKKDQQGNIHKQQAERINQGQRYKLPATSSKKRSKSRKMPQSERSFLSNKQQVNDKQGQQQEESQFKENKLDMVSNSVSVAYTPILKKDAEKQVKQVAPIPQKQQKNAPIAQQEQVISNKTNSKMSFPGIKEVNLKINSIGVKLYKNNNQFLGKFVKISMRNKSPFLTETINLSQNLVWNGKGYVFDKVSPFSEFKVSLCCQDKGGPIAIGSCKICLALLEMNKENSVQFYHQFLRDDDQNLVGQLIIGYESFNKKGRSKSVNKVQDGFDQYQRPRSNIQQRKKLKSPKKKRKYKQQNKKQSKGKQEEKRDAMNKDSNKETKKSAKIGTEGTQPNNLVGSVNPIRAKKYTGGNIIIGRAARFDNEKKKYDPGPGEYKSPSYFQKYKESNSADEV